MNVKQKVANLVKRELKEVARMAETAGSGSKWWASLSPAAQAKYLKEHPMSDHGTGSKGNGNAWHHAEREIEGHIQALHGKVQPHRDHAEFLMKAAKLAGHKWPDKPGVKGNSGENKPSPGKTMELLEHLRKGLPKVNVAKGSKLHGDKHALAGTWANTIVKKHAAADMANEGFWTADQGLKQAAHVANAGHMMREGKDHKSVGKYLDRQGIWSGTTTSKSGLQLRKHLSGSGE